MLDTLILHVGVDTILELELQFAAYVRPMGRVCISGVRATQIHRVIDAYSVHFDGLVVDEEDGWALVHGVRNGMPVPALG